MVDCLQHVADLAVDEGIVVEVVGGAIGLQAVQVVEDAVSAVGEADDEDIAGAVNDAVSVGSAVDVVAEVSEDVDFAVALHDTSPCVGPSMVPRSCLEVAEGSLEVAVAESSQEVAQRKQAALTRSSAHQPQG